MVSHPVFVSFNGHTPSEWLNFPDAIKIYEKQLGPDHHNVAQSLNNLALLLDAQGKYVKAEPLYCRALGILEKSLGPDHPDTRTVRQNYEILLSQMRSQLGK